ncbi:hypothetical protein [Phaeocystidibacter luteus]|uniref:YdeI/OmpD-associated family protein n=1 Tax=Phaeocystidibacter luteus TaxID=911197 RepID=A0A6N6RD25_9FLAO|nr:hypothetical protein [Phaeocystidibacter luteus]KAB2806826.1 YdeI/OmpD-associated family protein [Phaeocystidibacter luteus]
MSKPFSKEFTGWIDANGDMNMVLIPDEIAAEFKSKKIRRIQAWLKGNGPIHRALNVNNGQTFLYLSKATMKEIDLLAFEEVEVKLAEDTTTYQAPEPAEWMELMNQDEEIRHRFAAITDGKKRAILFAVSRPKSTEARLRKALSLADELRMGSIQ